MAKAAPCPDCKASLQSVMLISGRTYYCSCCGWNCEAAKSQIRAELFSMMFVAVLALALAVFVWHKNPGMHWMAAAIVVAALAVPLCNGVPAYRHLRHLKSLQPLATVDPRNER